MRYAIFSDVHGNRQAWEAVLADMVDLEVQVFVCLGDMVGYGPRPQEVLREIRACTRNIVVGNHDAAAAGLLDASIFNPVARKAIDWTREQLDEESLAFLSQLPMAIETDGLLFVHAEVIDPGRFGYIDTIEDARNNFAIHDHRVTFVGHTHRSTHFRLEEDGTVVQSPERSCTLDRTRRHIVNVGSVGEPRTPDDVRARYVVYDSDTGKLYFRRIEFDTEAYRRDLAESGLEVTPFFLRVLDHERAKATAERALTGGAGAAVRGGPGMAYVGPSDIVLPSGTVSDTSDRPVPQPTPARNKTRRVATLATLILLPFLAGVIGGAILFAKRGWNLKPVAETGPPPSPPTAPAEELPSIDPPVEPIAKVEDGMRETDEGDLPAEVMEAPLVEPAPVAPVPEIPVVDATATSPAPEPEPEPVVTVEPVPPREDLPVVTSFGSDLLFHAPFDEVGGASILQDQSGGGRDLEAPFANIGKVGEIGQISRAVQLSEGESLTSTPRILPKLEALAVSFWLKIPASSDLKEGEEKAPAPSGILVALHDYAAIRMEKGQLMADLDRNKEQIRIGFPKDGGWHHVFVENAAGITSIWIDGSTRPDPRPEVLPEVPPGELAVRIGPLDFPFLIDEPTIWHRPLTRDERCVLFRTGEHGSQLLPPVRTLARWSFDDPAGSTLLRDEAGNHLGPYKLWKPVAPIAPDPVPLTSKPNPSAASVMQLGEKPAKAGTFRMTEEAAFTYEGWVAFSDGTGGSLGGTLTGSGAPGWRLAARRDEGDHGFLAFMYETGSGKTQALARDLPLFDGHPHHFAAVWNPRDSGTHGKLFLYLDNQEVATATLGHDDLSPDANGPFHIEGKRAFVLDELRFTAAALKPALFLTAGLNLPPPKQAEPGEELAPPETETVLQRRDREAKERSLRQAEERKRKKEEAKAEADRKRAEIEKRRQEEEEKRKRDKLGED